MAVLWQPAQVRAAPNHSFKADGYAAA